MVKLNELRIGDNAVRGIKDTVNQKLVGLSGALFYGWDRTSWPIAFFILNSQSNTLQDKEAFDRRRTDSKRLCETIGIITFNSKLPDKPPILIAASYPIT